MSVVGAGTMGAQIAAQCALSGFDVWLIDTDEAQLERAVLSNRGHLQRRVDKGKLTEIDLEETMASIHVSDEVDAVAETQFVIEAVIEQLEVKQTLFCDLARIAPSSAVLASNSSTIGISQIADQVDVAARSRCINMHFFHPVLVMKLVEVMRGPDTSDETVELTTELARRIGREPVLINREVYGLLVNRILGAIKREAFWLAEQGYASPEDIDRAVKLGLNHPMGPFELSDFSGLDVFYYAALQRYRETGDERDRPPRILEEKVERGDLGRKTGKGFYSY
ncbi:MAG: 3-hydroxyacyl-CoA dehydrogenase family protein [Chloroflexota bacterium]